MRLIYGTGVQRMSWLSITATPPGPGMDAPVWGIHAINQAVWGLLGHLVRTNDPLGSQRKTAGGHQ